MTTRQGNKKKSQGMQALEKLTGGPLTLGEFLWAIREGEGWSQTEIGRRLKVSRAHICDIEKGRRTISPERAARWAKTLGYPKTQMVRLALQAMVDSAKLKMRVEINAA